MVKLSNLIDLTLSGEILEMAVGFSVSGSAVQDRK